MSGETISAEQIDGLEELITEILNRKITQIPSEVEDIEKLKKSPAGTIIRLEEHVSAMDEKIDEIRTQMKAEFTAMSGRIDKIESQMATKQDLEHMATKEELNVLAQEVKALNIRLEEHGKRLALFQTITYSFLGAIFAMMVGILVKLFLP
jgi:hypothetical protein